MAQGSSGAQSKLGELFVDFGTKGVGGLLKNLNTVSASFLLGKNAAVQLAQTLSQPIKQTGEYAVQLRNLRNQMGLTNKEAQKIQNWAKEYSLDEGAVLGDFSSVMKDLTQIKMYNKIPQGWYEAARLLMQQGGVDISKNRYNNTPEDTIRFIQDVGAGLEKISDIGTRRLIQEQLGLSPEVLTYYKYLNEMLEDTNILSDEQVDNIEEMQKAYNRLTTARDKLWQKGVATVAPPITNGLNYTADFISPGEKGGLERSKAFSTLLHTQLGAFLPGPISGLMYAAEDSYFKKKKNSPFELQPELDSLGDSDLLHSNIGNGDTIYNNINVEQNISTPDPISAGNQAAAKIDEITAAGQRLNTGR